MLARLFKTEKLFSFLFCVSFIIIFSIVYGMMDLSRQVHNIENALTYYESVDETSYQCTINDNISKLINCHLKNGNITIKVDALGIGSNTMKSGIDIVVLQNEPVTELVKYDEENTFLGSTSPACFVNEQLKNQLNKKNGVLYLNVSGKEYPVVGWVASKNLINNYDRVIVLNMPEKDIIKLCSGKVVTLKYSSNGKLTNEDKTSFKMWVESNFAIPETENEISKDTEQYISRKSFNRFLSYYKIVYGIIIVFCFFNVSFLAYSWGRKRIFNLTIKRTFGFKFLSLLADVFKEFFIYESISVTIVILGTFLFECIDESMSVWIENIQMGYLFAIIVMIGFGIVLSVFTLIWVYKYKPIEGLKLADQ